MDDDEVIIEKKIVPARRDRTGPYAYLLVTAFILTYALVMFGDRLGIMPPAPHAVHTADAPAPPASKAE